MRPGIAVLLLTALWASPAGAQAERGQVRGHVTDSSKLPLPGVTVTLTPQPAPATPVVVVTDGAGLFQFDVPRGGYTLTADLSGFQKEVRTDIAVGADPVTIDLVLPLAAFTQETQVVAQVPRLMSSRDPTAPATVDKDVIKIAPVQGLRYDSGLPLLPTAVRGPDGLISFGGARSSQGTVLVDRMRESDPVTGEPAITIPIAAIDTVQVLAPAPPADAGPGTAGITLVNTRRGADAFGFTVSTFVPRPRFGGGAGAVNGIESWQPNVGLSGPIVHERAWFAEALEYRWERFQNETVRGLQDTKLSAFTSFTRLDARVGAANHVSARVAVFPENRQHVGLDAFAPAASVPDQRSRAVSAAFAARVTRRADTVEFGFQAKRLGFGLAPAGSGPYSVGHTLVQGSFYRTVDRTARRFEGSVVWTHLVSGWKGDHAFRAGAAAGRASVGGTALNRPVSYLRSDGTIAQVVRFDGPGTLEAAATDAGAFLEDTWSPARNVRVDAGVRVDRPGVPAGLAVWPRAGVSFGLGDRTTLTAGGGVFAGKQTLNAAVFAERQGRRVELFDDAGAPVGAPRAFTNRTGRLAVPRATVVYVQVDRTLARDWMVRVRGEAREGVHELTVNPVDSAGANETGTLLLTSTGSSHARSVEITVGYRSPHAARQAYISYVRSSSVGSLNDLNSLTGAGATARVLPDEQGPLAADVPHRLLAWGIMALPWRFTLAPFLEIRSGFPFTPIDEAWNPVGPRNGARFPLFASLDVAVEKALELPIIPPLRLGVKFFNILGRSNGRQIQADVQRPDYRYTFNPVRRQVRFSMEIVWSR